MGDAAAIIGVGLVVLAWVGVSVVMPIVALISARRAHRELELLRGELTELRRQSAGVPPPPAVIVTPPPAVIVTPAPAVVVTPPPAVVVVTPPVAEAPPVAATPPAPVLPVIN